MAKHGVKRSRPAELVPGTLRVISLRMNYAPPDARDSGQVLADGGTCVHLALCLGTRIITRSCVTVWRTGR